MNENRKAGKFQNIVNIVDKKFASMNKGSKILVKIASYVLFGFLVGALFLTAADMTGILRFENQGRMIEWISIYAFRTWALLFCGALIIDYLRGGEKEGK